MGHKNSEYYHVCISVCAEFYAGGFNVLVHVFMYTYYALSAMGPQVQKYLWWKKYLTKLQMVVYLFIHYPLLVLLSV